MTLDKPLLEKFELQLNPQNLRASAFASTLLGYGEISSIFRLDQMPEIALKRMPLFSGLEQARAYETSYYEYCAALTQAGLRLPGDDTHIVKKSAGLFVLYIAQESFRSENFGHKLIHSRDEIFSADLILRILRALNTVWAFNETAAPGLELAIDGQISNWVLNETDELVYVDTSTPIFKKDGMEQMKPELILRSAPSFLRAVIKAFFLKDVMDRYYQKRAVLTDLVANLYKEQKPELIPMALDVINEKITGQTPLSPKEIKSYYKEDKFIWSLFLFARRVDRWITTRIKKKSYEFILPGRIKR